MSNYTDLEHEKALENTLYWQSGTIKTPVQGYEFGRYQERLKDYKEAACWYLYASDNGYIPASYSYVICVMKQLGISDQNEDIHQLLPVMFDYYQEKKETPEDYYRLGMLYKMGWGINQDKNEALTNFKIAAKQNYGDASYEIALCFINGIENSDKDYDMTRQYLRKAYDEHCEDAIFKDFAIFRGDFNEYEYQREIKEAYSFKLGQLIRVAELRQSKESIQNVIQMYQNGYPGDTGAKRQEFIRKADKYIKQISSHYDIK
ncbi:MAG: tetratricopeptide repeat protein [Lachnotalea sp.]